jgi:hypothetical protein
MMIGCPTLRMKVPPPPQIPVIVVLLDEWGSTSAVYSFLIIILSRLYQAP